MSGRLSTAALLAWAIGAAVLTQGQEGGGRRGPTGDDLPAAPNLLDVTVNGRAVKAVAQVTKQGFVYAFDRVTGNNGDRIRKHPRLRDLDLPPLGGAGARAGPLVTKTLLIYPLDADGERSPRLVAYDKRTAERLDPSTFRARRSVRR
jgi:hypothetical protein